MGQQNLIDAVVSIGDPSIPNSGEPLGSLPLDFLVGIVSLVGISGNLKNIWRYLGDLIINYYGSVNQPTDAEYCRVGFRITPSRAGLAEFGHHDGDRST